MTEDREAGLRRLLDAASAIFDDLYATGYDDEGVMANRIVAWWDEYDALEVG